MPAGIDTNATGGVDLEISSGMMDTTIADGMTSAMDDVAVAFRAIEHNQ